MPSLRRHVDFQAKLGIRLPIVLVVSFLKGIEHQDPEEMDLRELSDRELLILEEEIKKILGRPSFPEAKVGYRLIQEEWKRRKRRF